MSALRSLRAGLGCLAVLPLLLAEAPAQPAPKPAPSVAKLIQLMQSSNPRVRQQALLALPTSPAAIRPAIPAVGALLSDRDPDVRRAATVILLNLGPA